MEQLSARNTVAGECQRETSIGGGVAKAQLNPWHFLVDVGECTGNARPPGTTTTRVAESYAARTKMNVDRYRGGQCGQMIIIT